MQDTAPGVSGTFWSLPVSSRAVTKQSSLTSGQGFHKGATQSCHPCRDCVGFYFGGHPKKRPKFWQASFYGMCGPHTMNNQWMGSLISQMGQARPVWLQNHRPEPRLPWLHSGRLWPGKKGCNAPCRAGAKWRKQRPLPFLLSASIPASDEYEMEVLNTPDCGATWNQVLFDGVLGAPEPCLS